MVHILTAFDQDLGGLSARVTRLGELAVTGVSDSLKALRAGDRELAKLVVLRDPAMDQLQATIENDAIKLIALRQPVADDLRRAVAAMKLGSNLERCGDLAKNIAKRAVVISETDLRPSLMRPISRMGALVLHRLESVLKAYVEGDVAAAVEVWTKDKEVDEHYESLFRELLTYMMGDPRVIEACAHLLFVAKNLERIGDHATNIAEQVHYEQTGEELESRPRL